jgi:hypothetical protein
MGTIPLSFEPRDAAAEAFGAELQRLEREVSEVNRQLDRLEAEMRMTLNDLARERFEC